MSVFSQIFPPSPCFTENSLSNLAGKVYIITGAAAGVGLELAQILYSKDATVYVGARSSTRAQGAIDTIQKKHPHSRGFLHPFVADLGHLVTIKPATEKFMERETRLDVLFLNAGVMTPPAGSKTQDGYDMELGTNSVGPFLLTRLLEPVLRSTALATATQPGNVRIVWVSTFINQNTPKDGVRFDEKGNPIQLAGMENYMQSKVGITLLGWEFANRLKNAGVISVSLNPGLMRTELQRHKPAAQRAIMGLIMKTPIHGAYTELYAGLSPEVTLSDSGSFYIPWGRRGEYSQTMKEAMSSQGGRESTSKRFFNWCDREVAVYLS